MTNNLFQPFTFPSGVTLKNRVIMAPMTTYSSEKNGDVSEQELAYYARRAKSGIGAVITACVYAEPLGVGFQYSIGAEDDSRIPSLRKLASVIKDNGAKAILQIFHAGRMSSSTILQGEQPVSASSIPVPREHAEAPREMSHEEIEKTITSFKEATRRAIEAGFDGVEIHGANTYLIQQFFSPHSNRRTDQWGGSLEKRMTFPLALVDAVKTAVKQYASQPFIVGYRLSPEEPFEPGITMEDTLALVRTLSAKDLDYIHVSASDFMGGSIRNEEDKNSRIALIQQEVGDKIPVIGVGALQTKEQVEHALEITPLISLGHALVQDPDWMKKIEQEKEDSIYQAVYLSKREELDIPDQLWNAIIRNPGWFKVEE